MNSFHPRYIYWELSNYCNLRCKHCFADAVRGKDSIVRDSLIYSTIENMRSKNMFAIRFGGGEPLMVPYIFDLISFCKAHEIEVDITTNGTLLNGEVLKKLYSAGLRELTISIDGLETSHDYIRGQGNYQRTYQAAIQAISYGKICLSLAFTVSSQNYSELERFVEKFISLGVKKFYFFRYCSNNNAKMLELSSEQLCITAKTILELSQKHTNITFIHEGFSFYVHQLMGHKKIKEGCNFLQNVLTIDFTGNVIVCAAIKKVLGNVYLDNIDMVYKNIANEQTLIQYIPDECLNCVWNTSCHGGCKSFSFSTSGDYRIKDSLCYFDTEFTNSDK